jgi:5-(aminomethyl)-3-furanmethanol phosphate kinase
LPNAVVLHGEGILNDRFEPSPAECSLIKLGGSLLTMPGLRQRLAANLRSLAKFPIVVVGGGGLADVIRDWDRIHRLPVADSDHLATRTLSISADLLQCLLPGSEFVQDFHRAAAVLSEGRVPIVDVPRALADSLMPKLPQGWEVTSDSMAAAIATVWRLGELILVKSTPCPAPDSCENAAAKGLVDRYFPHAVARRIPVRWCDGTHQTWRAETWLGGDDLTSNGILH